MYTVELRRLDRESNGYDLARYGGIVRNPEASIAVLATWALMGWKIMPLMVAVQCQWK